MTTKTGKRLVVFQADPELARLAAEAAQRLTISTSAWWRQAGIRMLKSS